MSIYAQSVTNKCGIMQSTSGLTDCYAIAKEGGCGAQKQQAFENQQAQTDVKLNITLTNVCFTLKMIIMNSLG